MPLPDRNPKIKCQTALISTTQPMTIATPIPEASGIPIARKPQMSIRIPQIIFPLPVAEVDVESFIAFSPFRPDRPQPLDRLLLANTCRQQRDDAHSFMQTKSIRVARASPA